MTLGGRRIIPSVLSVLKECAICKRYTGKPLSINIPFLGVDRVRDTVVYVLTGIDFTGRLFLKNGEKTWVCLFTCAVYRTTHLELVSFLSTNSFLQTFRSFVSIRGHPSVLYRDNGIKVVGLENELKQLLLKLQFTE